MVIMSYDTDSQSRNALASPLGEEGHEVAKGCTRVRMIMTLDMDVTAERRHYNLRPLKGKRLTTFCASLRSGGRRLAVRKMIECHISAQPRTPFCLFEAFPLKGKREVWRRKTASHILHVPFRRFPPLVAGATTFPPQAGALWMLSNGAMSLQESIERFILSPGWGKVRRSRIRGSRATANHQDANQAI